MIDLPVEVVYGGASFGAARAAEQVLNRRGAQSAFFLYGAVAPSWWDAVWPPGVPAQAHQAESDPWREVETEQEFLAAVPKAELFVTRPPVISSPRPGIPTMTPPAPNSRRTESWRSWRRAGSSESRRVRFASL